MSAKYEKLKTLLKELFQLDQPDLDFGLYRIMHAKSAEVTQFLDRDLLPQVRQAFAAYKTADKAELERDLTKAIEQAQALGADPESLPKVKDLRTRLANEAVDIGQLEGEVYDHLFSFFRRYYSDGDFLAKRVYKPGVYAIPYEGEEVTLHWANKDQYYIKTSEYLRDYAFRLRPDAAKDPMRVHFRLVDVAEGEHGNVKAAEGKDRVFILASGGESGRDFVAVEKGEHGPELSLRFEYRPASLTDWPQDVRESKSKPPTQKDLSAAAVHRLLSVSDTSLAPWIEELGKTHMLASGEKAEYTRLESHLHRYTKRNTFDYFIHKDLGGFLRRELDFYIKNEVNRVTSRLSVDHEYIHVFASHGSALQGRVIDRSTFKNPDNDPRGPYTTDPLTGKANAADRPNLHYIIVNPTTGDEYPPHPDFGWITDPEGFAALLHDQRIYWPANPHSGNPRKKRFLSEAAERAPVSSLEISITQGEGNRDLAALFGEKLFSFPKPVSVIKTVVDVCSQSTALVMDFFAGSGTTGEAVVSLNRQASSSRRYFLVEGGHYFDQLCVPRLLKSIGASEWASGKPIRLDGTDRTGFQYVRLESYEDALNNLEIRRTERQHEVLEVAEARGADGLEEQYMLRYMLDVETRGSSSLLNVQAFHDAT